MVPDTLLLEVPEMMDTPPILLILQKALCCKSLFSLKLFIIISI